MTRDELVSKLMDLAAVRFKKPREKLNAQDDFFETLAIDSFEAMELMTDIEEEFEVEVPDYELQGVKTFDALANVIEKRI